MRLVSMEQVVFLNKPKDIQQSLLTVEQNNILSTFIEWCCLNYSPEKNTVSPYHYHCEDVMNYWYIITTLTHHVSIGNESFCIFISPFSPLSELIMQALRPVHWKKNMSYNPTRNFFGQHPSIPSISL